MTTDFDFVFAVPGQNHIIDAARPDGRSQINGQTLDEIRARGKEYQDVVLMPWEEYRAAQVARQNTPIVWEETTAENYEEMLSVLPPAVWDSYGFMVGEACDHSLETGKARFQAYRCINGRYEAASRPMTIKEFKECR